MTGEHSIKKVAILGASGFVANRMVESFHLGGESSVVPVVRNVTGLATISRFDIPWRIADSRNGQALGEAIKSCDVVVDCVVGNPDVIVQAAEQLIPAAAQAGVKRVVYLSSASVHGQNPPIGSNEDSMLSDRQEMPYNNAKVRAERRLLSDAARHGVELFVLRPSIVFGPRDRWTTTLARELSNRQAWLIEDGAGICNTIYVDNLVHAVRCCLSAPASSAGQVYLVGDAERVTWKELYLRAAELLHLDSGGIRYVDAPPVPKRKWSDHLESIRVRPDTQRVMAKIPDVLKRVTKGAIGGLRASVLPNPWLPPGEPGVQCSREMVLLQNCRHQFSHEKARKLLGYEPQVSFAEGLRRTAEWIQWTQS